MKFEFSNFELYVRIQNQNFELWYSIATCIKSIWHGKRYCYIISLNNWDVHDLFVHSWQTLNSPTIWSSPPLPSHYTWAYVCGHQGRWDCGRSTSVFTRVDQLDLLYVTAWLIGAAGATCCHSVGGRAPVSSHWCQHQNITARLQRSGNKGQGLVAATESRVHKRSSNLIQILPTEIRI